MRRSQMTIMESQNTIREMKTEVRDMLEDLKQRMGREPSPRQVQDRIREHDRARVGNQYMEEYEPREWRNQTVMMKPQDEDNHVIPESEEQHYPFSKTLHYESKGKSESLKYAPRYRQATNKEKQEDLQMESSPVHINLRHERGAQDYNKANDKQGNNINQNYHNQHDTYSRPTIEMMQQNPEAINIYGMKKYVKVRFTHSDTLFQSYSIFRQQCRPYGIYLSDISQITHKESSMCPTQVNGINIGDDRKEEMSNIIYDYLYDEKIIPLTYQTARAALKRCGPKLDGYSVLFQMLAETHPRIASQDVTNVAPLYSECEDLDEFTNKFENFFQCEELDLRTYTPRQKLVLFMKALPIEFEKALMRINAILDTTGKDQSIPPDLELSRLSVTLTKYMREAGVPIPQGLEGSSSSKVSKADFKKTRNDLNKETKSKRSPRKQLVDVFCKGCGQYGHEVTTCIVVAKHICVEKWIEKADKETKQSVMKSYRQKQQERKEESLKQAVRSLKMTLEKGEDDPAAQLVESHLIRLMSGSAQPQLPFEVSDSEASDEEASVTESVIDEE